MRIKTIFLSCSIVTTTNFFSLSVEAAKVTENALRKDSTFAKASAGKQDEAKKVEAAKKVEEAKKRAEEAQKKVEAAKKEEEEKKAKEAEEAQKKVEAAKKEEEEKKTKEAEEAKKKEEETKGKEEKEEEQDNEDRIGFDTVNVKEPEGNWLLKRAWWEKAERKYEKIKRVVSRIIESRMAFFEKRNAVEKNILDPFYGDVGLRQGELSEVISDLVSKLNEEREEGVVLSVEERDFLDKLESEKKSLERTKKDVDAIEKLDVLIDESLSKLMKQINLSRKYEEIAWTLFKDIANVFSHKKARELYHKMDALWTNVQDIESYIKGKFSAYFNSLIDTARNQTDRIKSTAEAFKAKGVDFKKYYKKLQGVPEKKALRKAQDDQEEEDEEEEDKDEPVGLIETIYNIVTWPFKKIWELISALWS